MSEILLLLSDQASYLSSLYSSALNTTSSFALFCRANAGDIAEVSYGAAKFAVESYSRSAAKELGRFGITVNIVSPGATQTGWISPAFEHDITVDTPLGRVGQPDDIADVVVFLCSHQARWVSGQLIHVGGGSTV